MTDNKPDQSSSTDSGRTSAGPEKHKSINEEWFHDSSLTESEALRAMIGKQRRKESEKHEGAKRSKKDEDEQS